MEALTLCKVINHLYMALTCGIKPEYLLPKSADYVN